MPFKFAGVTDERDTCELCGKQHLKRCVVLQDLTHGGYVYYGTDCAARVLMPQANDRVTKKEAEKFNVIYDDFYKIKNLIDTWRAKGYDNKTIYKGLIAKFNGEVELKDDKFYFYYNKERFALE